MTGASSGMGAEYARQFAARGLDVLLIARRTSRLEELACELERHTGVRAHVLTLDLADLDAAEKVRVEVERIGAPVVWLVNNAGYGVLRQFDAVGVDEYRRLVRVLAMAPIEFTLALLPHLKAAAPSHVINVTSLAAFLYGTPGMNLYGPLKAMLLKLSEALSLEFEMTGVDVTVTASVPGATDTEMLQNQGDDVDLSKFKVMPASVVVREAIAAADAGRVCVVHGASNKLAAFLSRHFPNAMRGAVRGYARMILPGDALVHR